MGNFEFTPFISGYGSESFRKFQIVRVLFCWFPVSSNQPTQTQPFVVYSIRHLGRQIQHPHLYIVSLLQLLVEPFLYLQHLDVSKSRSDSTKRKPCKTWWEQNAICPICYTCLIFTHAFEMLGSTSHTVAS